MLSKDIAKVAPGWSIWDDGCPPGETPGETPQQMSDRVDKVIAKVRKIHAEVSAVLRAPWCQGEASTEIRIHDCDAPSVSVSSA